jgi:hypothetical protein
LADDRFDNSLLSLGSRLNLNLRAQFFKIESQISFQAPMDAFFSFAYNKRKGLVLFPLGDLFGFRRIPLFRLLF